MPANHFILGLGGTGGRIIRAFRKTIHQEFRNNSLEGASVQYQQLTRGAERLSLDFRFRTGSSQLDNKALADIDRVTSLLSDLHYSGHNVLLFGFADSVGTAPDSVILSKDRAQAVSGQFSQRGVEPGLVTGFGADMPVASNDTGEGRQKNRRAEIWIKK